MNNQRGMMITSLLAAGATGAAIYGISRGLQNGTFQQMSKNVTSALINSQPVQQMAKPVVGMAVNSTLQQTLSGQNK
ncbi:hypothetical protein [Bacillus thermotolerans]|uniref:hypothetical protein n=1 Tax=Bacillus thermotolerans TaxID=1221996 RepID=UPI000583D1A5|nr:hypothetical protein [Bacillus thermotolerans]KKB34413.1 hypothetical protein QY97_02486 [Bacillus thermotolerans]